MISIYAVNQLLHSPKRKKMILDTDTYNEVDDQFALAYAMLAQDKLELLSVNAAPFWNSRSTSPEDGMKKSYQEILHIIQLTDPDRKLPVYKGSRRYLTNETTPEVTPAAQNIVDTVMQSDEPIFVVAIGAATNVASAILMEPKLIDRMIFVWLGGHSLQWPDSREFNMVQDLFASRVMMDCGVATIQIPCFGVCSVLTISVPELDACLTGQNELCDYLANIVKECAGKSLCWTRIIWDISAVAALALPDAALREERPMPRLDSGCCYVQDPTRHPMLYTRYLFRDAIFSDVFMRLRSR